MQPNQKRQKANEQTSGYLRGMGKERLQNGTRKL